MSSEQMERELLAVNVGDVYPVPDDAGEEINDDLCDWIDGGVKPVHEGPYVRSFDEGEGLSWWYEGQWFTDSFFGPASDIQDAPWRGMVSRAAAKQKQACDFGVGCEEAGMCYAAAHGEPGRCGRAAAQLAKGAEK